MGKTKFFQQLSFDEAQDAEENCNDMNYNEIENLLFNELLTNIRQTPFDHIIENYILTQDSPVYRTEEAHSLFWLYRADRKFIGSTTIYSFRFANACHPESYRTFDTTAHHLFTRVVKRHRSEGWYEYVGTNLLNDIDRYLNIRRVNDRPHTTKLFLNQNEERLDIQFRFEDSNERIAITFEPGYPDTSRLG